MTTILHPTSFLKFCCTSHLYCCLKIFSLNYASTHLLQESGGVCESRRQVNGQSRRNFPRQSGVIAPKTFGYIALSAPPGEVDQGGEIRRCFDIKYRRCQLDRQNRPHNSLPPTFTNDDRFEHPKSLAQCAERFEQYFWSINLDVYTPSCRPTSLFARTPVVYKNKAVIFVISKCRSCSNNKLWAYNGSILLSGIPRTAQVEIYKEILYQSKRWGLHAYVPCWYFFTSRLERRELASMNATFTAWKSTSRYRKCVGCQILSAVMA